MSTTDEPGSESLRVPLRDQLSLPPRYTQLMDGTLVYTADQMRAYAEQRVAAERERCARICDVTPPYPFRPSIEAAHAIRNQKA